RLEPDRVEIRRAAHVAAGLELREAVVDRAAVVGHALVAALREQRRRAGAVETEEPELERGRAEVGDENVHICDWRWPIADFVRGGRDARRARHAREKLPQRERQRRGRITTPAPAR